jgi:eukaryotic-like serine/threonine-protein kinase
VERDGSQAEAGVRQGDVLAGKYRVEQVIGVGGMGVVVAAQHMQLGERVALKFLLPATLQDSEAVGRFAREARAAARIKSEHVARVFDVGTLENGAPYMVMEFLDGEDLKRWLERCGPLPVDQAVDFVLQACVAVADAHSLGIIHRDLKPANLFCIRRSDGQFIIKVLDFGISKLTGAGPVSAGMAATKTSAVIGSPLYMSPEQVQNSKDVDTRTDVWALGVILFQLLTDRVPFEGEAFGEIAVKIAIRQPPSIHDIRPEVPLGLETVVLKCLDKERERRYSNVAELAQALLPFAPERGKSLVERITGILQGAGLSASAVPAPTSPSSPPRTGTAASPRDGNASSPPREATALEPSVAPWTGTMAGRKRKKAVVGALAGAGLLGAAGIVFALRYSTRPGPTSTGNEHPPPHLADVHDSPVSDACLPNVTKCDGTKLRTCDSLGKWSDGSIVAGQCGAACSPESSLPRCSGNVPQSCGSIGQWVDGPVCKVCSGGACLRACAPGAAQCTNTTAVQTCESDGEWGPPVVCNKSSTCRNGVCSRLAVAPAKPDCDPNYTIDPKSGAHVFKPECFSK